MAPNLHSHRLSIRISLTLASFFLAACGSTHSSLLESPSRAATHEAEAARAERSRATRLNAYASDTYDIEYTSTGTRDCDAEQISCFRRCWNTQPPYPITRGDKGHNKYCTKKCREEYMECIKELETRPLAFPDMKTAKDWLESHKAEVIVGSVILVAGAAFVISTGGSGAILLVPLVAL